MTWFRFKNLESYSVYGGVTTKYFSIDKDNRQGDRASVLIFTLALEVFFMEMKSNSTVKD